MNKNEKILIEKFKRISEKGWIISSNKGSGAIGLTFEHELHKRPDNRYLPDFNGIEIKCTSTSNMYPITLFSIAFDGPTFPEINRIVEKYGYYDKKYNNRKIISANINNKKLYVVNNKYIFKLEVDYSEKKIYLCVFDINNNLVEKKSYVYISNLYKHIKLKIKSLAIVYGKKTKYDNDVYF